MIPCRSPYRAKFNPYAFLRFIALRAAGFDQAENLRTGSIMSYSEKVDNLPRITSD